MRLSKLLALAILFLPLACRAYEERIDFDPGTYVGLNAIVVAGKLIELREGVEYPLGFADPSQVCLYTRGRLLVYGVVRQKPPLCVVPGDTLIFWHRTSRDCIDLDHPDVTIFVTHLPPPLTAAVGDSGLFAFDYKRPDRSFRTGWEFFQTGQNAAAIHAFLHALAADSAGTVAEWQARHPDRPLRF